MTRHASYGVDARRRDEYEDADDSAVVGVAISTRNYQALLHHSGMDAMAMSHGHGNGHAQDQRRSDLAASTAIASGPDAENDAVVGLPVATRNYMALLHGQPHSTPAAIPVTQRPSSDNQVEVGADAGDDNTVLGLPISTRNYLAMYRDNSNNQPVRQRGYSELASRKDRSTEGGSRWAAGNDPATTGGRSASGQRTKRESCFDTRRTSGAVVPQKGWLYIQSPTLKSWKRFYAVASGLDFRYSRDQGKSPIGFGVIQSVRRWDAKPFGLQLVFVSGKELPVYCGSEAEREAWLETINKALDKRHTSTGQSKTSYTVSAAEEHEGFLYRQQRDKSWAPQFFSFRSDGYLTCKDDVNAPVDARSSGYVRSVGFADVHPNGLVIQLDSGLAIFVYAESYDDRMLWFSAISACASVNEKSSYRSTSVKSPYVQMARPNYAGWLYKQTGVFKSWKRVYVTLHGVEMGYARDANSPLEECEKVHSVEDWDGRQHGLEIRFKSGQIWRVFAESYETAKHWRNVIAEMNRHAEHVTIKRYLASRKRKNLPPVFGGWLTTTARNGSRMRQFYVMDGAMFGVADDVDNLLQPLGSIVDVGATREIANGMIIAFADGSQLKVAGDSVESAKAWYDCISSTL
ncbi:hypothetical protein P43SY_009183 [Pythium insidiosum]|uniref:PH domain-containing protein n=1 Tax=Pythium insidiosum TaxID=114742 RepID=A0AAD5M805_PYTIN|nr:hypothetical protein P43SY_009183 [Pythium insidiosum]